MIWSLIISHLKNKVFIFISLSLSPHHSLTYFTSIRLLLIHRNWMNGKKCRFYFYFYVLLVLHYSKISSSIKKNNNNGFFYILYIYFTHFFHFTILSMNRIHFGIKLRIELNFLLFQFLCSGSCALFFLFSLQYTTVQSIIVELNMVQSCYIAECLKIEWNEERMRLEWNFFLSLHKQFSYVNNRARNSNLEVSHDNDNNIKMRPLSINQLAILKYLFYPHFFLLFFSTPHRNDWLTVPYLFDRTLFPLIKTFQFATRVCNEICYMCCLYHEHENITFMLYNFKHFQIDDDARW
jgi:hypothetical protein